MNPLFSVSQAKIKVWAGQATFIPEAGEGSSSKLTQVVDRIQFFEAIGLTSLFPCWLSAGNQSLLLEAACTAIRTSDVDSSINVDGVLLTRQTALTSPFITSL